MSSTNKQGIEIHTQEEFEGMRKAGKLAAEVLDMISEHVKPGVTTSELNDLCHDFIIKNGATPAPLNYKGFPKSVCTSVNHVVCHGIPDDKKLREGDCLNIDTTVIVSALPKLSIGSIVKNIPSSNITLLPAPSL
jgi:methionyl aminopeptidase